MLSGENGGEIKEGIRLKALNTRRNNCFGRESSGSQWGFSISLFLGGVGIYIVLGTETLVWNYRFGKGGMGEEEVGLSA